MRNKTESAIKDKIESASLADLMPGFDLEATWDKISVKLQEQPVKKKMLWWYMPAAAAVLLGICIAYFFFQNNKEVVLPQTTAAHTTRPKALTPMVAQPLQNPDTSKAMVQNLKAKVVKQAQPSNAPKGESMPNNVPIQPPLIVAHIPTADTARTVPVAVAKPLPVKHFLDIDNEDQAMMKRGQQSSPKPSYQERIAQRIGKGRSLDQNALPLREIYYAISN